MGLFGFGSLSQSKKAEKYAVAISIGASSLEGAVYSVEEQAIIRSNIFRLPPSIISTAGDTLADPQALGDLMLNLMKDMAAPTRAVHLCVPCTLMRVVELPKMEDDEYYLSLASEAERFRAFDNTEAVIQFDKLAEASSPVNQRLVYNAIRKDTFLAYQRLMKQARLSIASFNVEPVQVMRSVFATGMMETLAQHAETPDFCWGTMMHEFDRLRFMVWKGQQLVDIREITVSGQLLSNTEENAVVLSDLVMELKRTLMAVRPHVPQFWFSHRINYVLLQHLQQELGVTFRSFQLPSTFQVDRTDIGMAVVGGVFSHQEPRPYQLNLLQSKSAVQTEASPFGLSLFNFKSDEGFGGEDALGEDNPLKKFVLPATLGATGMVGIVWLLLFGIILFQENFQQQNSRSGKQLEESIDRLNTKVNQYKQSYLLSTKILSVADSSKEVNGILLGLLADVQYLPSSLWLSEISYDKQVSITGYALQHQDIAAITKSFEQRPYGRNFVLHHITEENLGNNTGTVYNFLLGGMLNTTQQEDVEAQTPSGNENAETDSFEDNDKNASFKKKEENIPLDEQE
jgi:Tfp pilus assembly PilM family ATPase